MNVVIIEDEPLSAQLLELLIHTYDPTIRVLTQLPSVEKAVQWFTATQPVLPDLLFLDIHLEDDLGFSLIQQLNLTIPIIFTTAYDTYALQAFKANSIDYLLKPIELADLTAALDKFRLIWQSTADVAPKLPNLEELVKNWQLPTPAYRNRFMVSIGPKLRSIRTEEIAYFFFEDKATYLMPQVGTPISIDYSLDKLSQVLDPAQFFRINRSFLVAITAIQSVHAYSGSKLKVDLAPSPRQEAYVTIDKVPEFKDWLGR